MDTVATKGKFELKEKDAYIMKSNGKSVWLNADGMKLLNSYAEHVGGQTSVANKANRHKVHVCRTFKKMRCGWKMFDSLYETIKNDTKYNGYTQRKTTGYKPAAK